MRKPKEAHVPANTNLLSVLMNDPQTMGWIVNNFINIRFNSDSGWDEFHRVGMWYECPWIEDNCFSRNFYDLNWSNFKDFVFRAIDNGYYVYISINMRHVRLYETNRNEDHNVFIYGYDRNIEAFLLTEFNFHGNFEFMCVPIAELQKGFETYFDVSHVTGETKIHLIKKKHKCDYRFSFEEMKGKLIDYLASTDPADRYHVDMYHMDTRGIGNYYCGISYYDGLLRVLKDTGDMSIRPLQLLVFRNYINRLRLEYIWGQIGCENGLGESLALLDRETRLVRNLVLKYKIKNEIGKNSVCIINRITQLKEIDRFFHEELIKRLSVKGFVRK